MALLALAAGCGNVVGPESDAGGLPSASGGGDAAPSDAPAADAAPPGGAPSDAPAAAPTAVALSQGADATKAGASGDTPTTDLCGSGQALTAFSGKNDDLGSGFVVVGTLGGTCAAVQVGGATASGYAVVPGATTSLPKRGSGNSTAWTLACPANQFVVGVATNSGDGLDQFQVQCAPMSLIRSGSSWAGRTGTVALVNGKAGGDGGGTIGAGLCPAGQVATGYATELWGGDEVASVTLKCSVVAGQ